MRYFFNQYFISPIAIIGTGHFARANRPFYNTGPRSVIAKGQIIAFALLVIFQISFKLFRIGISEIFKASYFDGEVVF